MKNSKSKFKLINSLLTFVILAFIVLGCGEKKPEGEVIDHQCQSDVGFVNGEMDYGVTVKVRIKNVGKAGYITINPVISTSEGEWERTQRLIFDENEAQNLTYFFPEPTINVSSVQCQIGVSP